MMMSTPSMIVCAVLLAGLLFAEDAAADWAANALDTDRNGPILFPSERILMAMSNKTETNNTSTAPTHMVTGVDGVARQFEIGIDVRSLSLILFRFSHFDYSFCSRATTNRTDRNCSACCSRCASRTRFARRTTAWCTPATMTPKIARASVWRAACPTPNASRSTTNGSRCTMPKSSWPTSRSRPAARPAAETCEIMDSVSRRV